MTDTRNYTDQPTDSRCVNTECPHPGSYRAMSIRLAPATSESATRVRVMLCPPCAGDYADTLHNLAAIAQNDLAQSVEYAVEDALKGRLREREPGRSMTVATTGRAPGSAA